MKENEPIDINSIQAYWSGKNVPQQWYSDRKPLTLAWFNEIRKKRYTTYYSYLKQDAEFQYHSGEKLLEIGCGIGTDLAEFALNGALVTGVDLGKDQVELTKLNFSLRSIPYEEIRQANAEDLDFMTGTFDIVYSFGVLHHTSNPQQSINEVHRVLKDDGQAIIMLYARGWKHYIKRCLLHGLLYGKYFRYGFNWAKVYSEVSEVHGGSPKTDVYTKKQIKEMFANFKYVQIEKKRMGEFFEYAPYRTYKLPHFFLSFCNFFKLETYLGENWLIKAYKSDPPKKTSIFKVLFKYY